MTCMKMVRLISKVRPQFSFSSGASPAHNAGGRVLSLFSQHSTDISHERSWQAWWQDDRRSLSAIVEGFFWMLCTRQTHLLALRSSLCSWRLSLVWYVQIKIMVINSIAENPRGRSIRNSNQQIWGLIMHSTELGINFLACRCNVLNEITRNQIAEHNCELWSYKLHIEIFTYIAIWCWKLAYAGVIFLSLQVMSPP